MSAPSLFPDVICGVETRQTEEDAIRILILSLKKHYPSPLPPIYFVCPAPTPAFEEWMTQQEGVILDQEPLEGTYQ
ncbi:MAG: hypothetical protein AAF603_07985, partial [Pseudomonadota bacterium]